MGWLGALGAWIVSAVTTAAVAVATVVATIIYAIGSVIAYCIYGVYSLASATVLGTISGLGLINSGTGAMLLSNMGALTGISASVYVSTITFVSTLVVGFKAFLEIIHFKTLLSIHNIAYLVSDDYRMWVNTAWYKIAEYSKALELGAGFIPLALNNTRSIVLDVTSMMGRSYDLGEVTWMSELGTWAANVSEMGTRYKNRPNLVFEDLANWIEKPYIDAKAGVVQNIVTTVEKTVEAADKMVYDLAKLNNDVDKMLSQLPSFIETYARPYFTKISERVDYFIYDEYAEHKKLMTQITATLTDQHTQHTERLDSLTDQMLHPGTMLKKVDELPADERETEIRKINDVVSEPYTYDSDERDDEGEDVMTELEKINALIMSETSHATWEYSESSVLMEQDIPDEDIYDTWYVGDF